MYRYIQKKPLQLSSVAPFPCCLISASRPFKQCRRQIRNGSDLVKMSANNQARGCEPRRNERRHLPPIFFGYLLETHDWHHCVRFGGNTANHTFKSKLLHNVTTSTGAAMSLDLQTRIPLQGPLYNINPSHINQDSCSLPANR